jgi:hypothetical protein
MEAAPLVSRGQAASPVAAELIDQRCLFAVLVTENVRADLPITTLVKTGHLLAIEDRPVEQQEGGTMSGAHHFKPLVRTIP